MERAGTFTKGREREEAWTATLDAKTIYQNIARAAQDAEQPQAVVPFGLNIFGKGNK